MVNASSELFDSSCGQIYAPWAREYLLEFDLMGGNWIPCVIKDEKASACGSLIDGADEPALGLVHILPREVLVPVTRFRHGARQWHLVANGVKGKRRS